MRKGCYFNFPPPTRETGRLSIPFPVTGIFSPNLPATSNLIPDVWFAALAIESGCEWITRASGLGLDFKTAGSAGEVA
jgi:hypothetical protein